MQSEYGTVIIHAKDQTTRDFLNENSTEMEVASFRQAASLLDMNSISDETWDSCEDDDPLVESDSWFGEYLLLEVGGEWVNFLKILATSSKLDIWASLWSDYEELYIASVDKMIFYKIIDTESGDCAEEVETEWRALLPEVILEEINRQKQEAGKEADNTVYKIYRLIDMPGFEDWKNRKLSNGGSKEAIEYMIERSVQIDPEEVFSNVEQFYEDFYNVTVEDFDGPEPIYGYLDD